MLIIKIVVGQHKYNQTASLSQLKPFSKAVCCQGESSKILIKINSSLWTKSRFQAQILQVSGDQFCPIFGQSEFHLRILLLLGLSFLFFSLSFLIFLFVFRLLFYPFYSILSFFLLSFISLSSLLFFLTFTFCYIYSFLSFLFLSFHSFFVLLLFFPFY